MIPANQNRESVITSVQDFVEEKSNLSPEQFATTLAGDRFLVVGEPETIECTACGGIGGLANGNECEVCEGYGSVPVPMALVTYTQYEILQGIDETRHAVEFKDDSWTIIHPLYERANHFLFDCPVNLDYLEEPPAIGRFWIEEDGTLTPMEKGNHARRVNS